MAPQYFFGFFYRKRPVNTAVPQLPLDVLVDLVRILSTGGMVWNNDSARYMRHASQRKAVSQIVDEVRVVLGEVVSFEVLLKSVCVVGSDNSFV